METMKEVFLQRRIDELDRAFSMMKAQIRNAISDIEEGDTDEAVETLKQIIGESE